MDELDELLERLQGRSTGILSMYIQGGDIGLCMGIAEQIEPAPRFHLLVLQGFIGNPIKALKTGGALKEALHHEISLDCLCNKSPETQDDGGFIGRKLGQIILWPSITPAVAEAVINRSLEEKAFLTGLYPRWELVQEKTRAANRLGRNLIERQALGQALWHASELQPQSWSAAISSEQSEILEACDRSWPNTESVRMLFT